MSAVTAPIRSARWPAGSKIGGVAAVVAGNALEFYDFLIFAFFAVQIGHSFFPARDPGSSLLLSLSTFGAGFLTRPLGGVVIGGISDRRGRKPAMLLAFTLMGCGTVGLALTPSYESIGIAAPIAVLAFRLLQGFALGGELGANTAYLIEAAGEGKRGVYTSMQYAAQDVAVFFAGLVGAGLANLLTEAQLAAWGWRLAFLLGAAIIPLALMARRKLPESLPAPAGNDGDGAGLRLLAPQLLLAAALLGSSMICAYIVDYLTVFSVTTLHMASGVAFGAAAVSGFCSIWGAPLGGYLSDRFGRRPMMMLPWIMLFLAVDPLFLAVAHFRSGFALFSAAAILSVLTAVGACSMLVGIAESIPARQRSRTIGVLYAIVVATVGGSAQAVVTWLINVSGNRLAPAFYMQAAIVVGLVAMSLYRESGFGHSSAPDEST